MYLVVRRAHTVALAARVASELAPHLSEVYGV
jgi:hypothetical protein